MSFAKKKLYNARFRFYLFVVFILLLEFCLWYFYLGKQNLVLLMVCFLIALVVYVKFSRFIDYINKIFDPYFDKIIKQKNSAKKGIQGEDLVFSWIIENFPMDKSFVYKNVVIPGYKSDIDCIVLCPYGLIAFEVKNLSSIYYFLSKNVFYKKEGIKFFSKIDPRIQVKRNALRLKNYLNFRNINIDFVKPVLVFVDKEKVYFQGPTGVYIVSGHQAFKNFVSSLIVDSKYDDTFCDQVDLVIKNIKN